MIKAIFFDIDGTLISYQTSMMPSSTIKALHVLQDRGIKIFVSTGRHVSEIKDLDMADLSFDGYITLNGSYCYNEKEAYYTNNIVQDDLDALLEEIKKEPFPCMMVEDTKMYINFHNEAVVEAQKRIHTPLPDLGDITRAKSHPIYQVIPYDISIDQQEHLMKKMPHCRATRWYDLACDIIPNNSGKQIGIEKTLEYYGISKDETMAFGDGDNDIDMIQYVHIGVAMGNANDALKQVADVVCDSVDDDGIYQTLKKYKLI